MANTTRTPKGFLQLDSPLLVPSWSTKPALHAAFVRSFFLLPNSVIIVFSLFLFVFLFHFPFFFFFFFFFFFVFHYFFLLLLLVVGVSTAYILTGRASRVLYVPAHRQDLFDLEALGVGCLHPTQT